MSLETNKPSEEELPNYYDELVPHSNIQWHTDKNVRRKEPEQELVSSIKKTGIKEPLTAYKEDGTYYITDGWQRQQCMIKAGYTHSPCDVYENEAEAMFEAERSSMQTPWTNYQNIKQYGELFKTHIEDGYNETEAINSIVNKSSVSAKTLKKYVKIYALPKISHILLKKPKNRRDDWEDFSFKFKGRINDSDGRLKIKNAKPIANAYDKGQINKAQAETFSVEAVVYNDERIISNALEKCSKHDTNVQEAVEKEAKRIQNRNCGGIYIGTVMFEQEDMKWFEAYKADKRVNSQKFARKAIEEKLQKVREEGIISEKYRP